MVHESGEAVLKQVSSEGHCGGIVLLYYLQLLGP